MNQALKYPDGDSFAEAQGRLKSASAALSVNFVGSI
jgi:hypothetical protein